MGYIYSSIKKEISNKMWCTMLFFLHNILYQGTINGIHIHTPPPHIYTHTRTYMCMCVEIIVHVPIFGFYDTSTVSLFSQQR